VATLSRRDAARAFVSLASTTALTALAAPAVAFGRGGHDGSPAPLPRAHAHNDYEHERPLLDALSYGFTSVEADVWLVDGELMVAHDSWDIRPGRTLQALYLDPLLARVRANGGQVYRGHRLSLQLLIDIKNTGEATYLALSRVLRQYRSLFSSAAGDRVRTGPVTAVISGDRAARAPMEAERVRYAFYDGRLDDLAGQTAPASFMPLISGNWTESFTWLGSGPMPAAERDQLRRLVATAHARGQRVRFWATPDAPGRERDAVWRELLAAGADHLNTDDLAGLAAFLRSAGR
jgi:hypothetical protein